MSRAQQAEERAAAWIIAQEDGPWTEAEQVAFEAWLNEADGHRTAFLRLRHSWRAADRIGALGTGLPLGAAEHRKVERRWLPAAIAASLLAIAGTSYFVTQADRSEPVTVVAQSYKTPVGGQKLVGLSDGSRVQLNTASALRTALSQTQREVWLDEGEAFFDVAHLEGRPFIVHVGNRRVTVLGTKFSVRRDGDKVIISVLEGRVRLDQADRTRAPHSAVIAGGDIAFARGDALVTTRSEDRVENALAWRTGMLAFDQARLEDVAKEFNRYNSRKIIIADAETGNFRIGGIFPASDPEAFVRLVGEAYGLRIEEKNEGAEKGSN